MKELDMPGIRRQSNPRFAARNDYGFTLVELMITMVIFVLALAAASQIFVGLLSNFKQQSRIAESNIEGVVGLEIMRTDLEQAGFGLCWDLDGGVYNNEAANAAAPNPADYNDAPGVPRAFVSGDNVGFNQSDYIVVKATNVATNAAAQRWTYINKVEGQPSLLRGWSSVSGDRLTGTDHIIALNLNDRRLINNAGDFSVQLNDPNFSFNPGGPNPPTFAFEPIRDRDQTFVVYGIKTDNPGGVLPRMPFNRADYYIRKVNPMPNRCAQDSADPTNPATGTGILYKATVNHDNGTLTELPLMDCVADMQIVYGLDTDNDRKVDTIEDGTLGALTAEQIRTQLREVRVYIVGHEGQRDPGFTYINPRMDPAHPDNFAVPAPPAPAANQIDIFYDNMSGANLTRSYLKSVTLPADPLMLNYRWKTYVLVITPYNVR